MNLPSCTGDYGIDGDFDCVSNHDLNCEDCLCNYHNMGGLWHPDTGKKLSKFMAFLFYGRRKPEKKLRKEPRSLGFWRDIVKEDFKNEN